MTFAPEKLRALHDAATPGPWAYRPDEYDDWGIVKSPPERLDGFEYDLRCVLAQFRDPKALDEEVLTEHRRAKTDPWRGNAELVVSLRNSVPAILSMAAEIARLRAQCEVMAKAIEHEGYRSTRLKQALTAYRAAYPEEG